MRSTISAGARQRHRSGSVLIEFSLSALLLFPMIIGVVITGMNLNRSVHVMQIARDVGSMFVRGVDFSATANQDIVIRLTQNMAMTRTGGSGVVFLSKVTYIPSAACIAVVGACNGNKYVVVQRLTIGNVAMTPIQKSRLGPAGNITIDSHGNVANTLTDPNTVVTPVLTGIITLAANEFAYVTEVYFLSLDLTSIGAAPGTGVYARAVF